MNVSYTDEEDALSELKVDQWNWMQLSGFNYNGNYSKEPPDNLVPPIGPNISWLDIRKKSEHIIDGSSNSTNTQ